MIGTADEVAAAMRWLCADAATMTAQKSGQNRCATAAQSVQIAYYETHRDALHHVVNFFRDTSTGTAVSYVIAAVVRAWITGSRTKLDRFAEVLVHGYSREGEEVIIRLRNYILRRRREQRQTQALRDDLYARTERAIEMFLANEDGPLTAAKDECFPLPEDEALRALAGESPAA